MKVVLGSNNRGKIKEISRHVSAIELVAPSKDMDVPETGTTFIENAQIKAEAFYHLDKTPTLSDDSGLVVNALPDELGVYSKRFGPADRQAQMNDRDRCEYLLERMQGKTDRSAYFITVLCLYLSPEQIFFFEGRLQGEIGHELKGSGGFGYDPIFLPTKLQAEQPGITLAQAEEFKSVESHRVNALKSLELSMPGIQKLMETALT